MATAERDLEPRQADRPSFTFRHTVSFKDTNVVGNVYYTNHLEWQGRCREHFLYTYVPSILDELRADLRIVTLRCSCDYFAELHAFDDVEIIMTLDTVDGHRISLIFEYRHDGRLIAQGFQQLGFMRVKPDGVFVPTEPPPDMVGALSRFGHQTRTNEGGDHVG